MLLYTSKTLYINLNKLAAKLYGLQERQFEFLASLNAKEFIHPHFDWCYIYELIKEISSRAEPDSYIDIVLDPYEEDKYRGRSITYSIAEDPDYIDNLCSYLKEADKATAIETISVIARLPVLTSKLKEMRLYIETHKIKKYEHWYTVLNVKFDQPEELMMKMKLLEEILNPKSEYSVRDQFIQNKGINFLIDIIVQSCTILINDGKVEKFPLCAALVSRTLKLFTSLVDNFAFMTLLDPETSLILIKSGLDFLEYMSEVGNNDKPLINLMSEQLERDTIITDIFDMFALVITYDNARFKSIYKHKKLKNMIFYYLIDSNKDFEKREISQSLINLTKKCHEISRKEFK
jgi:hypothetical protein